MSLKDKIKRVKQLESDIGTVILKSLAKHTNDIEELNRQQLREGKDAEGNINPNYRKSNKKTGSLKFHDTGEYYNSIIASVTGTEIDIDSIDPKAKYLNPYFGHGYGIETLGLSPESLAKLQTEVMDTITLEIKNYLK